MTEMITRELVERYLDSTLIQDLKASALKFQFLEKWERTTFYGLTRAREKLG